MFSIAHDESTWNMTTNREESYRRRRFIANGRNLAKPQSFWAWLRWYLTK